MTYPKTIEEIRNADKITVCRWHRFATTDGMLSICNDDLDKAIAMNNELYNRVHELGGFTPEISKQIGWELE